MRAHFAFVALGSLMVSAPLPAQMRPGMPPVAGGELRPNMPQVNPRRMEADPGERFRQISADFAEKNRAQGSPRILLFWNRKLDDETTTRYRSRDRGTSMVARRPGLAVGAYDRIQEQERTTGGTYEDMHPDDSSAYESAFLSAFLRAGANIVDRDALMRKVSAGSDAPDRADQQFIESQALEQGVAYLLEVLPSYGSGPDGLVFQVKLTHLPTSAVKAQFRTAASPPSGPERLVARSGGFERHRDRCDTTECVAEQLAAEAMQRMF